MALNIDAKFEIKLTFAFKNDMRNLVNFQQSTWKSQNWDFDGILLSSRKCMSLKFTGNILVMTVKKRCKIVRGSNLLFQIWHEDFDEFWLEHLKISKLCFFMRCLWAKYIIFGLKNYRGDIFNSTEDWCKIWRKIDLCFLKWHEEFAKFLFTGWKIVISF